MSLALITCYWIAFFSSRTSALLANPPYLSARIFGSRAPSSASSLAAVASTPTTLTDETTWNLRFLLQGMPTENGKKVDEIFTIRAQFVEEEGYEPPQGYVKQLGAPSDDSSPRLRIVKSRWQLSEDPSDRKDGLWIWGLFKEPLYPFLLLQLETDCIPLPGDQQDAVKPLKLFAQIDHKREKEIGVVLSGGDLNVRETETMKGERIDLFTVLFNYLFFVISTPSSGSDYAFLTVSSK
jgi:hypothetical protein